MVPPWCLVTNFTAKKHRTEQHHTKNLQQLINRGCESEALLAGNELSKQLYNGGRDRRAQPRRVESASPGEYFEVGHLGLLSLTSSVSSHCAPGG